MVVVVCLVGFLKLSWCTQVQEGEWRTRIPAVRRIVTSKSTSKPYTCTLHSHFPGGSSPFLSPQQLMAFSLCALFIGCNADIDIVGGLGMSARRARRWARTQRELKVNLKPSKHQPHHRPSDLDLTGHPWPSRSPQIQVPINCTQACRQAVPKAGPFFAVCKLRAQFAPNSIRLQLNKSLQSFSSILKTQAYF